MPNKKPIHLYRLNLNCMRPEAYLLQCPGILSIRALCVSNGPQPNHDDGGCGTGPIT